MVLRVTFKDRFRGSCDAVMASLAHEGDAESIPLTISRQPIEEEGFPMHRMTRDRFPGMFR